MVTAIRAVPPRSPWGRRYEDLTWQSFKPRPSDGRYYANYRDEHGKQRSIYRYQWVWQQANGPIPHGYQIHHLNHDPKDDRVENLSAMTVAEHRSYHNEDFIDKALLSRGLRRTGVPEWTCEYCGKAFRARMRESRTPRRFCSIACYHVSQRL